MESIFIVTYSFVLCSLYEKSTMTWPRLLKRYWSNKCSRIYASTTKIELLLHLRIVDTTNDLPSAELKIDSLNNNRVIQPYCVTGMILKRSDKLINFDE